MTTAFERLHTGIKRVLWDMKWESLRQFQVDAIHAWLDRRSDLVLMANTASGKTEAAFLPILSSIADDKGAGSVRVLYVGPLKALINDQFRRVEDLCQRVEIPVHRWHGDVSADRKRDVIREPSGVLLITPESLEALLMRRGREIRRMFSKLEAVVIDEMHAFLDSERGRQLSTQLRRLDAVRQGSPPTRRVGLSATIGDVPVALRWIRREGADEATLITSESTRDIELLIKTFVHEKPVPSPSGAPSEAATEEPPPDESSGLLSVAQHIAENLHGSTNLVFCNRKSDIEILADDLGELCERLRRPNEYLVHHGSLSKQIRENVEAELQSGRPCTALCSSTLELGIDVGYVDSVGQIEPPYSVSSLKQRLGRSGRRPGQPSRLWLYVPTLRKTAKEPLPERLYPSLLQSVAMTTLMLEKWTEPPDSVLEDFSTLIQQTLSLIVERGGVSAQEAHRLLCGGPAFSAVDPPTYMALLRDLGMHDLINQTANKDLILGLAGEKITGHYDFFAAFETADEYDVVEGTRHIGNIQLMPGMYKPGDNILLAGRRWKVLEIDEEQGVLLVKRTSDRKAPHWGGGGGHVHRRIRERMLEILTNERSFPFLDPTSVDVLRWARETAAQAELRVRCWIRDEKDTTVFTWAGSRAHFTLNLLFRALGIQCMDHGIAFSFEGNGDDVRAVLSRFVSDRPKAVDLVLRAFPKDIPPTGKHGSYLSRDLRAKAFADRHLDISGALTCADILLSRVN